ncbi:MAG TPA: type 1 glutamine amidotransferase [Verrucomicrobiae bacterium]|nr:type 1 glutamine amidotransferase [Verrucomicrobiae bacterium]
MTQAGGVERPPTVLMVAHSADDGPGALGRALRRSGLALQLHRTDRDGPPPPTVRGLDGLVVLGGSMSARSSWGFPTRDAEVRLLEAALRADLPILGICLGAQLLAVAGGGRVVKGRSKEIGFTAVERLPAGSDDPLLGAGPERFAPLSWHEDQCLPPTSAVRLARSDAYPVQAFRIGERAHGVQFHPEVGVGEVRAWVRGAPADAALAKGGAAGLLGAAGARLAALRPVRRAIFLGYAALVRSHCAVAA